ncbi:MAG TPA: DUF4232 domain-containing protein [Trebonia sp.]|nr:DUF4232 domain-containing protein [Trebonia sp.]
MRPAVRYAWRGVAMVAFGATAALAVTLNRPAAVPAAMATSTTKIARCAPARLAVSLAHDPDGSWYPLEFTNTSHDACTLTGYPDVAAYDDRGQGYQQVGFPADQYATGAARQVLLRPGATAHAYLDVWTALPGRACQPVTVTGLRIIAPGTSRPWYVRARLTACSATGPGARPGLRVQSIKSGPGHKGTVPA